MEEGNFIESIFFQPYIREKSCTSDVYYSQDFMNNVYPFAAANSDGHFNQRKSKPAEALRCIDIIFSRTKLLKHENIQT